MGNSWGIVSPVATTNYVLNPSAGIAGNFAAVGAATVTRVTTYQKYGLNSYRVQTTGAGQGISLTLSALTNAVHFATARIRNPGAPLRFTIGSGVKTVVKLETISEGWALYGIVFSAAQASGATALQITQVGGGAKDFNVDGIQVEPLSYPTTYCDGTQEGCEWTGIEHASISLRSGQSRAGGKVNDFFEAYGFFVEKIIGAGATSRDVAVDSYSVLPGGELNNVKIEPRELTIVGRFLADSEAELHAKRQALYAELSTDRYPSFQPIKLRFSGAIVQKELGVYYRSGLEGDLSALYGNFEPGDQSWTSLSKFTERATIQLVAPDPYWYEVGESAASLDTNDSATFRVIAARLRSTGQWSPLGPPSAGGTYVIVYAILEDATYVYIGGDFDNWDGIAAADNIVRYEKATGIYTALDVGLNGTVQALALAPNGDLYIGGSFTNAGGVAAADFVARWDGTDYNAVGVPVAGAAAIVTVWALIFDHSGILYIGGDFANWANIAAADSIVMWNGTAYSAMGAGLGAGQVSCLAVGLDNILYLGGTFNNAGGDLNADRLAQWNGTAFSSVIAGFSLTSVGLEAMAIDPNTGVLYFSGPFEDAGGITGINFIAAWAGGSTPMALGGGINNAAYSLAVDANSLLYLGGNFTSAGGIALSDRVAKWNGYSFAHLDVDLPGSPTVFEIFASTRVDPVVPQKYDLFLGFDTTGTGNFAGKVSITNEGTVPAFPMIVYNRSGGTAAIVETLKNEQTGKELLFNYSLLDGETLVVDLAQTEKDIQSSFFGKRLDAILPNSDFGLWALLPGDNTLTAFVGTTGSPTVTAYLLWRDAYDGYD